jgi:hypothetical protein
MRNYQKQIDKTREDGLQLLNNPGKRTRFLYVGKENLPFLTGFLKIELVVVSKIAI